MLTWIISSSVLILTILGIRLIFKGKISMRLQYALWAIVMVRLLFPGSIMESSFSVMNAVDVTESQETTNDNKNIFGIENLFQSSESQEENQKEQGIVQDTGSLNAENDAIGNPSSGVGKTGNHATGNQGAGLNAGNLNAGDSNEGSANAGNSNISNSNGNGLNTGNRGTEVAPSTEKADVVNESVTADTKAITADVMLQQIQALAPTLWIGGMLALGLCFLFSNVYFGNRLKRSRVMIREKKEKQLPLYTSSLIETPCLSGLFRPAVYLTEDVMKDADMMEHVLAHEETHYRHKDHVWSILRCICLVVHWYNPLVWIAAMASKQDAELACDEGTIARLGEDKRTAYGRTVIGLTYMKPKPEALLLTATSMSGSKSSIKERVTMIAKKPKMAMYILVAVLMIAMVAVGCTFTGAKVGSRAGEEQHQDVKNDEDSGDVSENDESNSDRNNNKINQDANNNNSNSDATYEPEEESGNVSGEAEGNQGEAEEEYVPQELPEWCPYSNFDMNYETAMWIEGLFTDVSAYFESYNGETIQRIGRFEQEGPATRGDVIYYTTESDNIQEIISTMAEAMIQPLTDAEYTSSYHIPYTITAYKFKEHKVHRVSDNVWLIDCINGYYKYDGVDMVDMESRKEVESSLMDEEGYFPFQREGSGGAFIYVLIRDGEKYRLQRLDDMRKLAQSDYQEIRTIWDPYFVEEESKLEFYNHGTLISYNPETREAVFNIQRWVVVSQEEARENNIPAGYYLEDLGEQTFVIDESCETWIFVEDSSYLEYGKINLEQLPSIVDAGYEGGYMPLMRIFVKDGKIMYLGHQYQA